MQDVREFDTHDREIDKLDILEPGFKDRKSVV